METNQISQKYIPLIDPAPLDEKLKNKNVNDSSLLVTSPEEIQRNLERWRDHNERLHIVV